MNEDVRGVNQAPDPGGGTYERARYAYEGVRRPGNLVHDLSTIAAAMTLLRSREIGRPSFQVGKRNV
jgi:hypothetical protein